jgi:two-component system cell cycle sensor histidine kinase/response regulator CckA
MDGPTWVAKAKEQRPDVKVIFVSGYAEESFTTEYGEISNASFLPKPFSLKQLIEMVRELAR